VESFSAKMLNVGFFKYLKEGKDKAEALRRVKTDMIKGAKGDRYKHPYYWAPLVLFGDGK
jgi:CHAT domain-containing protein